MFYTYATRLLFLFACLCALPLAAQEICDNGVDDDGDGLIDLRDTTDCNCDIPAAVRSLLPNPSFEEFAADQEGCASSQTGGLPDGPGQVDCIVGWIKASDATTDSWNAFTYSGNGPFFPEAIPQPLPSGSGVAGFWTNILSPNSYDGLGNQVSYYREYLGACLNDNGRLIPGTDYRIDMTLGWMTEQFYDARDENGIEVEDGGRISSPADLTMTLYGIRRCEDVRFDGNQCVENSDTDGWEAIRNFSVTGTPGSWREVSVNFTVPREYEAIALGGACIERPEQNRPAWREYYFIDDVRLNLEQAFEQPTGGPVRVVGSSVCDDDIRLFATTFDGATYQWYKDGVALPGATGDTYRVLPGADIDGEYQVRTSTAAGCSVSDPVVIQRPVIPLNLFADTFNICMPGDTIFVFAQGSFNADYTWEDGTMERFITVADPGDYTVTVNTECEQRIEGYTVVVEGDPSFSATAEGEGCYFVGSEVEIFFETDWNYSGAFILYEDQPGNARFVDFVSDSVTIDSLPGLRLLIVAETPSCEPDTVVIELPTGGALDFEAEIPTLSCANPSGSIVLSTDFPDPVTYQWVDPDGQDIPGATGLTLNVSEPGTYLLRSEQAGGCSGENEFTVTLDEAFPLTLSVASEACEDLHTITTTADATAPLSYNWERDGVPIPGGAVLQGVGPGTYAVTVTDANGCTNQQRATASPVDLLRLLSVEPFADCDSEGGILSVTAAGGTPPYVYLVVESTNPLDTGLITLDSDVPVPGTGTYVIVVADQDSCTVQSEPVELVRPVDFTVEAGRDQRIRLGETVRLRGLVAPEVLPGMIVSWTNNSGDSLSCTNCLDPTGRPVGRTTYVLTAVSREGCVRADSLTVEVDPAVDFYFPTAFSPNADGVNDVYRAFPGIGVDIIEELNIYDRWGQHSYAFNAASPGWDGLVDGEPAAVGVYVYYGTIRLLDGRRVPVEGSFTLLR